MKANDDRYLEIEQTLTVFSFSKVQSVLTIIKLLEMQDIELDEVKEYVELRRELSAASSALILERQKKSMEIWEKNARHCPDCSKVLLLRAIIIPKGKGNMKGYTSQWFCANEKCSFEEYGFEDVNEVHQKVMEGTYNADN